MIPVDLAAERQRVQKLVDAYAHPETRAGHHALENAEDDAPKLARQLIEALGELERLTASMEELAHRWDTLAKGIYFDLPDDSTPENVERGKCQISEAYTLEGCAAHLRAALAPAPEERP